MVPGNTGTFFSNRYPVDGTRFCYGNMAIADPVLDSEALELSNNTQQAGKIGADTYIQEVAKKYGLPNSSAVGNMTLGDCDGS